MIVVHRKERGTMSVLTPEENDLLNLLYVKKMTPEQVAKQRGMDVKFVERLRDIALKKLEQPKSPF